MKRTFFSAACLLLLTASYAQSINKQLQKAWQYFEADSQLKHAISSLYVIDAQTGQVVFDRHSRIGLAPASTQKIITSVTAFELLGKDYRYKTEFYHNNQLPLPNGNILLVNGKGDPTFGSWRYEQTKPSAIFDKLGAAFASKLRGSVLLMVLDTAFERQSIPDGWIWQDIGNYYGAGASGFNWKENQVDVGLTSGNTSGDPVKVENYGELFIDSSQTGMVDNTLKSAAKGTGDNAYYYFGYGNTRNRDPLFKGTIPVNEKNFKISIAVADPAYLFTEEYFKRWSSSTGNSTGDPDPIAIHQWIQAIKSSITAPVYTHHSPTLDSIIYWFNKKSINLYGEALIKTFAYEKQGLGSTDSGVAILKRFWKERGLEENELNMYDGSGLSPLNRVTTHAQVEILKYARSKEWYSSFYDALPEYNNMKMKSGTISDVKGFCGYHRAQNGKEYIFSFLVNNYSGRASQLVNKMYKVLDILK
jgi:D-alanyl-D-alanine carboxypeptidase/D-alanyl-D-alanine-endopeptidase (penicillin-binding protein 4)